MLDSDARKVATAIEERVTGDADRPVSTKVSKERIRPQVAPTPGSTPPLIAYYFVEVTDGNRTAKLSLDEASDLLDEVQPGWDPDRLFDAIRAMELPVEDVE